MQFPMQEDKAGGAKSKHVDPYEEGEKRVLSLIQGGCGLPPARLHGPLRSEARRARAGCGEVESGSVTQQGPKLEAGLHARHSNRHQASSPESLPSTCACMVTHDRGFPRELLGGGLILLCERLAHLAARLTKSDALERVRPSPPIHRRPCASDERRSNSKARLISNGKPKEGGGNLALIGKRGEGVDVEAARLHRETAEA